jgi:predicted signal transduction protein with EAL and GGDEF domain
MLLRQTAERLGRALRDTDTAARLGGDEFALVLEGFSDHDQITVVIDRVLAALREPMMLEGRQISVSGSVGLSVAESGADPDELLRNADAAMYAAKKSGKNRCATFDPTMQAHGVNRLELRTELESALRREEFVLHYQPIIALGSTRVAGFEALVRWNHPTRGLVAPLDFIPVAEETGLIVPLGRWILAEACVQAKQWQDTSPTPVGLSINLSAVQLRNSDVIDDVASALAAADLPASCLTLEVTETALIGDVDRVALVLTGLKTLGVRVAIDDFGTGYSSFAHLQSLPIDSIKVDRSFVSVVGDGPSRRPTRRRL